MSFYKIYYICYNLLRDHIVRNPFWELIVNICNSFNFLLLFGLDSKLGFFCKLHHFKVWSSNYLFPESKIIPELAFGPGRLGTLTCKVLRLQKDDKAVSEAINAN